MQARALLAAFIMSVVAMSGVGSPATAAPVERLVAGVGPSGYLKGVMLEPAPRAKAPVVLIVPGSGPTNRDGDNTHGVRAGTYRLLAEGLAAQGVTSMRVDKRGMFGSAAPDLDPNKVTIADYASDVTSWADALKPITGAPCIWVLGHSEGALVALAAAVQRPDDICGLILAASPGRRLSDVLRDQLRAEAAYAPILKQALAAIGQLEQGRHVDVSGYPERLKMLFHPTVQTYLINAFAYDPVDLLKRYAGPVLVLQGSTDLQVSNADAERLKAARPDVRLVMLPGVNHVLKAAPADRAANLATYGDPLLPIAPAAVEAVAAFVKAAPQTAARSEP